MIIRRTGKKRQKAGIFTLNTGVFHEVIVFIFYRLRKIKINQMLTLVQKDLRVYQIILNFIKSVYKLNESFPKDEQFSLTCR